MAYAKTEDVEKGFRTLSSDEKKQCGQLLDEAGVIIDCYANTASDDIKKVVSCRMVRRALGTGSSSIVPMGAIQGTQSGFGYSQSWQLNDGSAGELYLGKLEKKMLGAGDRIGSHSPIEDLNNA